MDGTSIMLILLKEKTHAPSIGNGEVESSILSRSTILINENNSLHSKQSFSHGKSYANGCTTRHTHPGKIRG